MCRISVLPQFSECISRELQQTLQIYHIFYNLRIPIIGDLEQKDTVASHNMSKANHISEIIHIIYVFAYDKNIHTCIIPNMDTMHPPSLLPHLNLQLTHSLTMCPRIQGIPVTPHNGLALSYATFHLPPCQMKGLGKCPMRQILLQHAGYVL